MVPVISIPLALGFGAVFATSKANIIEGDNLQVMVSLQSQFADAIDQQARTATLRHKC